MLGECRQKYAHGVLFTKWLFDWNPLLLIPEIGCVNYFHARWRTEGPTSDPLTGLSCSAFFSQYCEISASGNCSADLLILGPDRIYGMVSFPEKIDRPGMLVRKHCPEPAGFPDKVRVVPRAKVFEY